MSRRKALRENRNRGAALVVVLCIMAVLMALSVALLLTASTTIGTAKNRVVNERCKALAATMSQVIADQICDTDIAKELGKQRIGLEPEFSVSDTIQEFLRDKMMGFVEKTDMEWPFFDDSGYLESVVPDEYIRKFNLADILAGKSSELAGYKLSVEMYWTAVKSDLEEGIKAAIVNGMRYDDGDIMLIVTVQCTKEEQMQRVVIGYLLETDLGKYIIKEADPENPGGFVDKEVKYAIWKWSKDDTT